MSDKCPGCGAEPIGRDLWACGADNQAWWDCTRHVALTTFRESLRCLRRQLAQRDKELAAAKVKNERLTHQLDGDWQCDGCNLWFPHTAANCGHECDLCEACAAEPAKENP